MKHRYIYLLALVLGVTLACTPSEKAPTKKPNVASVAFVNLKDGDTVQNPFTVKFGVSRMTVVKMGAAGGADKGHHHLIIDGKPIEYGQMVPMNPTHLHFMGGETEHSLSLAPGKHAHSTIRGHGPSVFWYPLSKTITVNVTGPCQRKPSRSRRWITLGIMGTMRWEPRVHKNQAQESVVCIFRHPSTTRLYPPRFHLGLVLMA